MSKTCEELHRLCNGMRQYRFEDLRDVPANGVYVFFEDGE